MRILFSISLMIFLGVIPCNAKSFSKAFILEPENTEVSGISEEMTDSLWLDLYYYTTKNGKKRLFFEMYGNDGSVLYATDNGQDSHEITLFYDRYDTEGWQSDFTAKRPYELKCPCQYDELWQAPQRESSGKATPQSTFSSIKIASAVTLATPNDTYGGRAVTPDAVS